MLNSARFVRATILGMVMLACIFTMAAKPDKTAGKPDNTKSPFSVYGIVTDEAGKPMAGVKVSAHCGVGTLRRTGETLSGADGKYTLYFGAGMHFRRDGASRASYVGLQSATIYATRDGFYERDLCEQGALGMAEDAPKDGAPSFVNPDLLVLPDKPFRVDFVMVPAARVRIQLLDESGKPMRKHTLSVSGPRLGPSTNALVTFETDDAGRAQFDAPCKTYWFELVSETGQWLKSAEVIFEWPGVYEITLTRITSDLNAIPLRAKVDVAPTGPTATK